MARIVQQKLNCACPLGHTLGGHEVYRLLFIFIATQGLDQICGLGRERRPSPHGAWAVFHDASLLSETGARCPSTPHGMTNWRTGTRPLQEMPRNEPPQGL